MQLTLNSDLEIKKEKNRKKKVQYHEEVEIIDPKPSNDKEEPLKKVSLYSNVQRPDLGDDSYDSIFMQEASKQSTVPFSASKMRTSSILDLGSQDR